MSIRTFSLLGLALVAFAGTRAAAEVDVTVRLGTGRHAVREEPRHVVVVEKDRHDHRRCHHRKYRTRWHGRSEPREVVVVEKRVVEPQPVLVVKETVPAPAPQPVAPSESPRPSRSMNSAD